MQFVKEVNNAAIIRVAGITTAININEFWFNPYSDATIIDNLWRIYIAKALVPSQFNAALPIFIFIESIITKMPKRGDAMNKNAAL